MHTVIFKADLRGSCSGYLQDVQLLAVIAHLTPIKWKQKVKLSWIMSYFTQMGCIKLNGGIIHASKFTKVKFHAENLGKCYRVGLFSTDCMDHSYLDICIYITFHAKEKDDGRGAGGKD